MRLCDFVFYVMCIRVDTYPLVLKVENLKLSTPMYFINFERIKNFLNKRIIPFFTKMTTADTRR